MTGIHRCYVARRGPRPPAFERCGPCEAREDHHWVVTAGTHVSVVRASCETGAREAVGSYLFPARRVDALPIAQMTCRPATTDDIARFDQMIEEATR